MDMGVKRVYKKGLENLFYKTGIRLKCVAELITPIQKTQTNALQTLGR